jgi:hypothetical protein
VCGNLIYGLNGVRIGFFDALQMALLRITGRKFTRMYYSASSHLNKTSKTHGWLAKCDIMDFSTNARMLANLLDAQSFHQSSCVTAISKTSTRP